MPVPSGRRPSAKGVRACGLAGVPPTSDSQKHSTADKSARPAFRSRLISKEVSSAIRPQAVRRRRPIAAKQLKPAAWRAFRPPAIPKSIPWQINLPGLLFGPA